MYEEMDERTKLTKLYKHRAQKWWTNGMIKHVCERNENTSLWDYWKEVTAFLYI